MSLIGGVSEGGALNYLGRSRAAVCFKSCADPLCYPHFLRSPVYYIPKDVSQANFWTPSKQQCIVDVPFSFGKWRYVSSAQLLKHTAALLLPRSFRAPPSDTPPIRDIGQHFFLTWQIFTHFSKA